MTATQDTAAREATSTSSQANNSITHPIINSPYDQPSRYWKLDHENRATSEQVAGRRPSAQFAGRAHSAAGRAAAAHPKPARERHPRGRWEVACRQIRGRNREYAVAAGSLD